MADTFSDLTIDKLKTSQGVNELNRLINFLVNSVAGDGVFQKVYSGSGTPEGSVVADKGSLFLRLDGGAGTSLYVKESGVQTALGWVGK